MKGKTEKYKQLNAPESQLLFSFSEICERIVFFFVDVVVKCTYTHPCIGIGMLLYIVPGKGILFFSSLLIVNTKNITFQIGKRKRVVSAEPLVVWPYPAAPSIESDLLSTKKGDPFYKEDPCTKE